MIKKAKILTFMKEINGLSSNDIYDKVFTTFPELKTHKQFCGWLLLNWRVLCEDPIPNLLDLNCLQNSLILVYEELSKIETIDVSKIGNSKEITSYITVEVNCFLVPLKSNVKTVGSIHDTMLAISKLVERCEIENSLSVKTFSLKSELQDGELYITVTLVI
jgi:hypothetical protein